ncbi:hypothetical protein PINS_up005010 [Pythium insidiosum]|nr:hypothetical protein PINS_up005010 [Pythium insidiosum]
MAPWMCTLVVSFATYIAIGVQRLPGGDSGELLAEACVGGVAHPPGYPLLLLLLRLTKTLGAVVAPQVPFVVFANILNAAFAAGAASCVTHSVWLITDRQTAVAAVFAGLLFAFCELTVEYAVGLEVFALNNLLIGALHTCFVRHFVTPISIANLSFLYEIPMIAWILATSRPSVGMLTRLACAFLVGLLPYSYTLLAATMPTPGSWGDTSTIGGLVRHILRQEYGTFKLSPQTALTEGFRERVMFYLADAAQELDVSGVAFAAIGLTALLVVGPRGMPSFAKTHPLPSISRWLGPAQLSCWVFYIGVFNALANLPLASPLPREVTRRFFLQPHLLLAVWSGVGVAMLEGLGERAKTRGRLSIVGLSLAVAALARRRIWTLLDPSLDTPDLIRAFGQQVLDGLPANALLLSYTDIQWNSVRYLQVCESRRTDIRHLNLQIMAFPWFRRQQPLFPEIRFPALRPDVSSDRLSRGYAVYLSEFIQTNSPLQPHMFLDLHALDEATIREDQLVFNGLQVLPHGLVWRVLCDPSRARDRWREYATTHKASTVLQRFQQLVPIQTTVEKSPLLRAGRWEFAALSIAHDAVYQRNLARLGYWLAHGKLATLRDLQDHVLSFASIQQELLAVLHRAVTLGSTKDVDGAVALSYALFAVEKNAVVSQQRFQLYLDALSDVVVTVDAHGHEVIDHETTTTELRELIAQRDESRDTAIRHSEAFLPSLLQENDADVAAIQEVLTRLRDRQSMTLQQKHRKQQTQPQQTQKKTTRKTKTKTKKTKATSSRKTAKHR